MKHEVSTHPCLGKGSVMDYHVHGVRGSEVPRIAQAVVSQQNFELDSFQYRQPLQFFQMWRNVIILFLSKDGNWIYYTVRHSFLSHAYMYLNLHRVCELCEPVFEMEVAAFRRRHRQLYGDMSSLLGKELGREVVVGARLNVTL